MKKLLLVLCSVACLSACAASLTVPYQVDSTPPGAQIYVNGVSMGIAPLQIELACDKRWACIAGTPCGWDFIDAVYEVTANLNIETLVLTQTQRVNACQLKALPGHISFDLKSDTFVP